MGAEQKRQRIIGQLKKTFLDAAKVEKGINKSDLVSEICMDHGVTKKKALEYLQVLFDGRFIEEELENLWLCAGVKPQVLSPEEDAFLSEKNLEEQKRTEEILKRDAALQEQGATD